MNRKTARLQAEDPRLEAVELPEGWSRLVNKSTDVYAAWRRHSTGEIFYNSDFDPRMTVEALEKQGVVFEAFDIV